MGKLVHIFVTIARNNRSISANLCLMSLDNFNGNQYN